jgi:hypothetical protein
MAAKKNQVFKVGDLVGSVQTMTSQTLGIGLVVDIYGAQYLKIQWFNHEHVNSLLLQKEWIDMRQEAGKSIYLLGPVEDRSLNAQKWEFKKK